MTDLQAAMGLVQLDRLDAIVARRREIAAAYQTHSPASAACAASTDPPGCRVELPVLLDRGLLGFPLDREGLLAHLAARDISARRGIMAAHRQPAYKGHPSGPLPITERLTDNTLILPVYHQMTVDERSRVIAAVCGAAGP